MNVLDYLNSRDVADYLKEIGFEFNAMQAAYVIYINERLTIEERMELWQEIVDTMADCEFQRIAGNSIYIERSAHEAIREHIEEVKQDLRDFLKSEYDGQRYVYVPVSSRWEYRPEWLDPTGKEYRQIKGGVWNDCIRAMPFTSFDECVKYLQKEASNSNSGSMWGKPVQFDRHRIGRTALNGFDANCYAHYSAWEPVNYYLQQITLNGDFEPIDIEMDWYGNVFEEVFPDIPIPFERGDILIDATGDTSLPFVYDRRPTWVPRNGGKAQKGHCEVGDQLKGQVPSTESNESWFAIDVGECEGAIGVRCGMMGSLLDSAHGQMYAYGYEINESDPDSVLKYSFGGAAGNYLNLEYFRGTFDDGKLSVLPVVSWFVMNEGADVVDHQSFVEVRMAAEERFKKRGIERPRFPMYDICSLVNTGYKLR